ncbi:hypothetical protein GCM10025868_41050 [Angustibacter aerolatus]|uniref:Acetyltransferase n=1 Tax=Angustibacter aerolatus TaxID=1162965 RepID=A0ABQ6JQ64_9ACTN|nr:hypothetical protein [Angustibacter aerolatus]GMA88855.1 hypothetical protein GCM10025868_41050 [Angustibacter aerolatus]
MSALLAVATGLRWLTLAGTAALVVDGPRWFPDVRWWALLPGWLLLLTPWGRMAGTVAVARTLLRGLRPGTYPRGGSVHLRLWAAQSVADALGADGLAGAPWIPVYARALGCRIGKKVDLHSLPPVTGMLTLGKRASVEPEVDLSGVWVEGDVVHVGRVRVGAGATVRTRTVLLPGARVGQDAEVSAGSAVGGSVPPDEPVVGVAGHQNRCRAPGLAAQAGSARRALGLGLRPHRRRARLPAGGVAGGRPARRAAGRRPLHRPGGRRRVGAGPGAAGRARGAAGAACCSPASPPGCCGSGCARATTRC